MLAARAGGDARVALAALERAAETTPAAGDGRGRDRRGRGRAAAQGAPLRPGGRPPLRLHLGLDQGDPRLRRRRLDLLPGGDARGRRGPALHRPADGDPRLRGHRQRRPAGARGRQRRRPGRRPGWAAGVRAQPRPGGRLPGAGAEVERRDQGDLAAPSAHVREHGAAEPPAYLQDAHYPGAAKLGRGEGYGYPHDEPGAVTDQPLAPEAVGTSASTSPPIAASRPSSGGVGGVCASVSVAALTEPDRLPA